ncbi:hypothetical protein NPIL_321041 [Nephila pilipes]|uniref:Uncharacterized protein n=1 Tax=Nephila pilipes TaxID=299642 RepID=A0A8X6P2Q8_NEPPI|nr:hypothetical protein NPIL_288841 [Nephila pilipes]GFT65550.1 hypothetical protein NPIL_34921 [Nephila pilipes]GFU04354.1 hypothetical protein NPIL_499671 [Nephila pilipes]GFU30158.1 hypothetical protein NPIL_321041 [Nephila pilipes]
MGNSRAKTERRIGISEAKTEVWRSGFAAIAEGYKKGESKQSAGAMNEEEMKYGLGEGEEHQSDLPLLR